MKYKITSEEIQARLAAWNDEVIRQVIFHTNERANELLKLIRDGAPVDWRKSKRRGKYKKSWRKKVTQDNGRIFEITVYSGGGEYRLTHLLEKGHKKSRGKGNVKAQAHIAPAYKKVKKEYEKDIEAVFKHAK